MWSRTVSVVCRLALATTVFSGPPQAAAAPPFLRSDLERMQGVWVSEVETPQGSYSVWARVWQKGNKFVIDLRFTAGAPGRPPNRLGDRSFPLARSGRDLVIEGIEPQFAGLGYRLRRDALEIEPVENTLIPDGEEMLLLPADETLRLRRAAGR